MVEIDSKLPNSTELTTGPSNESNGVVFLESEELLDDSVSKGFLDAEL